MSAKTCRGHFLTYRSLLTVPQISLYFPPSCFFHMLFSLPQMPLLSSAQKTHNYASRSNRNNMPYEALSSLYCLKRKQLEELVCFIQLFLPYFVNVLLTAFFALPVLFSLLLPYQLMSSLKERIMYIYLYYRPGVGQTFP